MGFEKTYRKRSVWGSHGKRTGINQRIASEFEKQNKRIIRLEKICFPTDKPAPRLRRKKKHKRAKWGRNKK